ncbi:MAG: hypothetical protein ACK5LM_01120 [Lactovum sp.]
MEQNFYEQFEQFLPIIYKASRSYRIQLWTMDDYKQEGLIVFYKLLEKGYPKESLPVYFKVQYRQHLINQLRRQSAIKRTYDLGNYIDIEAIHQYLADRSFSIGDDLLFSDTLESFKQYLKKKDLQILNRILAGEKVSRVQKFRLKQKLITFLKDEK